MTMLEAVSGIRTHNNLHPAKPDGYKPFADLAQKLEHKAKTFELLPFPGESKSSEQSQIPDESKSSKKQQSPRAYVRWLEHTNAAIETHKDNAYRYNSDSLLNSVPFNTVEALINQYGKAEEILATSDLQHTQPDLAIRSIVARKSLCDHVRVPDDKTLAAISSQFQSRQTAQTYAAMQETAKDIFGMYRQTETFITSIETQGDHAVDTILQLGGLSEGEYIIAAAKVVQLDALDERFHEKAKEQRLAIHIGEETYTLDASLAVKLMATDKRIEELTQVQPLTLEDTKLLRTLRGKRNGWLTKIGLPTLGSSSQDDAPSKRMRDRFMHALAQKTEHLTMYIDARVEKDQLIDVMIGTYNEETGAVVRPHRDEKRKALGKIKRGYNAFFSGPTTSIWPSDFYVNNKHTDPSRWQEYVKTTQVAAVDGSAGHDVDVVFTDYQDLPGWRATEPKLRAPGEKKAIGRATITRDDIIDAEMTKAAEMAAPGLTLETMDAETRVLYEQFSRAVNGAFWSLPESSQAALFEAWLQAGSEKQEAKILGSLQAPFIETTKPSHTALRLPITRDFHLDYIIDRFGSTKPKEWIDAWEFGDVTRVSLETDPQRTNDFRTITLHDSDGTHTLAYSAFMQAISAKTVRDIKGIQTTIQGTEFVSGPIGRQVDDVLINQSTAFDKLETVFQRLTINGVRHQDIELEIVYAEKK